MIFQAIDCIRSAMVKAGIPAVLGNIGEILAGNNNAADELVISLINIEENRVARNPQNFVRNGTEIRMKNPAVHLDLTLLFTSVRLDGGYEMALQSIQQAILFFQGNYVFDHINTPVLDPGIEKLIMDLFSLNFEQLHQLWAMLGGRYHPSVIYRMRMITIDSVSDIVGTPINEITTNYSQK